MKMLPTNETELRLYAVGYLDGKVNGYSSMDGDYWYKRGQRGLPITANKEIQMGKYDDMFKQPPREPFEPTPWLIVLLILKVFPQFQFDF